MRQTTDSVSATIVPIANSAEVQSEAAESASTSTNELVAGVAQLSATATSLRDQAGALRTLIAAFRLVTQKHAPGRSARILIEDSLKLVHRSVLY
jgi:methyl-accepting chemotaxis protein